MAFFCQSARQRRVFALLPCSCSVGGAGHRVLNRAQMCSVEVLIGASDQENGAALRGESSGTDRKKNTSACVGLVLTCVWSVFVHQGPLVIG